MDRIGTGLSSLQTFTLARQRAGQLTEAMSIASEEASTGLLANPVRALGTRLADSLILRTQLERNESFITSNTLLDGRLELTEIAINSTRSVVSEFVGTVLPGSAVNGEQARVYQTYALSTLDQVVNSLNVQQGGNFLFSGTTSGTPPLQQWSEVNPNSGLSPQAVVESILGAGPTTVAEADALYAELKDVFDGATGQPAGFTFEETFYNGTPLLQPSGQPSSRVATPIDAELVVEHGVQANDEPFRNVLLGLSMIAGTDPSAFPDDDAYAHWMELATSAIQEGLDELVFVESATGAKRGSLAETIELQQRNATHINNQIVALEGVDPYEAATRLALLETQLESTYTITARLQNLSFVNFV